MNKNNNKHPNSIELFWKNKQLEDLPNEIWIDAYGYDGIYSVSNLGRVKSEERRVPTFRGDRLVRARILSQVKGEDRLHVNLSVGNIMKTHQVNQLIYYSFNPDKLSGEKHKNEVYHLNKIGYDNRLENLGHNKIKGTSYSISIKLGNVKHLDEARRKLNAYSNETAIIKNGRTTHRVCIKCGKLKEQSQYEEYGRNICLDCRKKDKKKDYENRLKEKGKTRKNNKTIIITDTVTGHKWTSNNKSRCIISKQQINKYANTGKIVYPYRNSKHVNPLLIETKTINI